MELPGYYSAQVQISAMIFNEEICSIKKPEWQGLLKSETLYFYYEGKTKIRIEPSQWSLNGKKTVIQAYNGQDRIFGESE